MRSLGRNAGAGRSEGQGARAAFGRTRRGWPRSAAEAVQKGSRGPHEGAKEMRGSAGALPREREAPAVRAPMPTVDCEGRPKHRDTYVFTRIPMGGQVTAARAAAAAAPGTAREARNSCMQKEDAVCRTRESASSQAL